MNILLIYYYKFLYSQNLLTSINQQAGTSSQSGGKTTSESLLTMDVTELLPDVRLKEPIFKCDDHAFAVPTASAPMNKRRTITPNPPPNNNNSYYNAQCLTDIQVEIIGLKHELEELGFLSSFQIKQKLLVQEHSVNGYCVVIDLFLTELEGPAYTVYSIQLNLDEAIEKQVNKEDEDIWPVTTLVIIFLINNINKHYSGTLKEISSSYRFTERLIVQNGNVVGLRVTKTMYLPNYDRFLKHTFLSWDIGNVIVQCGRNGQM